VTAKIYVPEFDWTNKRVIEIVSIASDGTVRISTPASAWFSLVSEVDRCDWVLIPAFLSSLADPIGKKLIQETAIVAQKAKKPFGVFSNSDLIIDPGVTDVFIFTPGAYSNQPNQVELPAVLPFDPIGKWFDGQWHPQTRVSLGFCGQATQNPLKTIKDLLKLEVMRLNKIRGKSLFLSIPLFLPAFERSRVLSKAAKSVKVPTDFVLRSHYKGGASDQQSSDRVEVEFFKNISSNLFTLCMRGMGNYSVRFYQTLAMGRIPVLIDTQSKLPFDTHLDYSELYVSVPYEERFEVERYILEYLAGKSPEQLEQIQSRCREFWLEHFCLEGMLRNLSTQLHILGREALPISH
jgi:hypothetical protein